MFCTLVGTHHYLGVEQHQAWCLTWSAPCPGCAPSSPCAAAPWLLSSAPLSRAAHPGTEIWSGSLTCDLGEEGASPHAWAGLACNLVEGHSYYCGGLEEGQAWMGAGQGVGQRGGQGA